MACSATCLPQGHADPLAQHGVVKFPLGSLSGCVAEAVPARRIDQEGAERGGSGSRIGRIIQDETSLSMDDWLVGTAAAACQLRHSGGGGLEKDDPKPLLLEPQPAVPAKHRPDVCRAVEKGEVVLGDAPKKVHSVLQSLAPNQPGETAKVASLPTDCEVQIREVRSQQGDSSYQHVDALSRHEPADAHDERPVGRQPESYASRLPLFGGKGAEPVEIDAWRDDDDARLMTSQNATCLCRRVAPERDDNLSGPQH